MVGMAADLASHYRYERKYQTELSAPEVQTVLLASSALLQPIYYRRRVNSLYFDTPEFEYFQQNVRGDAVRKKVRVRWYGEDAAPTQFQIEIKSREGELIRKESQLYSVVDVWSENALTDVVRSELSTVLPEAGVLVPTLRNHYWRSYFASSSTAIRVTVDDGLVFEGQGLETTIVECKYPIAADALLRELVQQLPLRVTKSSKYVLGMQVARYVD